MPIDELNAIRQKYPGKYDDLGDGDLAGMLAAKYPAYKDLPDRVAAESKPSPYSGLAGGAEAKIQRTPGFLQSLSEETKAAFRPGKTLADTGVNPLQLLSAPFNAISRGTTKYAAENLNITPLQADLAGESASFLAGLVPVPVGRAASAVKGLFPKARTVEELLPQRAALPTGPAAIAPPPPQRALPPPEMVMEATPDLTTPGGAVMRGTVSPAPKRTIIDLIDEVKQDVKNQVMEEIFQELRTGRTAAMPRVQRPQQIEPPRLQLPPPEKVIYEGTPEGQLSATAWRPVPKESITNARGQAADFMEGARPTITETPAPLPIKAPETTALDTLKERYDRVKTPALKKQIEQQWIESHELEKIPIGSGYGQITGTGADTTMTAAPQSQIDEILKPLREGPQAPAAPKAPRQTKSDIVSVMQGIERESDPATLLTLAIDGKTPRDLQRMAGDRLNDFKIKDLAVALETLDDEALKKLSRSGAVSQQVSFQAKGLLNRRVKTTPVAEEMAPRTPEEMIREHQTTKILQEAEAKGRPAATPDIAAETGKPQIHTGQPWVKVPDKSLKQLNNYLANNPVEVRKNVTGPTDHRITIKAPDGTGLELGQYGEDWHITGWNGPKFGKAGSTMAKAEVEATIRNLTSAPKPGAERSLGDILKSEKGQVGSTETNPFVTSSRLAIGETFEQAGKTVRKTMGPEGNELIDRLTEIRNKGERETGIASQPIEDAVKKIKKGAEYENFVDVLEGNAAPVNQNVANAAKLADPVRREIAGRAVDVDLQVKNPITGEYHPFRPKDNYFPHYSKEELSKLVEDPTRRADIKAQIKAELGPNATDRQAEQALQAMIKATKGREGHLEIARVLDFGDYHKDPRAFLKYINDAYRRINTAEQLGPRLEKAEELLAKIGQNHGDKAESFARTLLNRELRLEQTPDTLAKSMMETARNYEVFTKLGRAFIPNLSQHAYTAIVAGTKNTGKAMGEAFTKGGKEFARRAGVINDEVIKEFLNEASGATGEGMLRKAIGIELKPFQWSERLNRTVAALSGRNYARETFDALVAKPGQAKLRQSLEKMGIDVDSALARGALSETDELKAAQNIVNRTQFKVDPIELPLFWSSPEGKLLTQFKSFNFKSGQFIKDEVLKELGKGNVAPFIRAVSILPPAGLAVKKVQNALKPSDDKKEGIADYLAAVGVLGLFSDLFRTSGRTGEGFLAGPTLSDIGQGVGAISTTRQNIQNEKPAPAKPLAKFLARQVPVMGPTLSGMLNEHKEKSPHDKILQELGMDRDSHKKLKSQLGLK